MYVYLLLLNILTFIMYGVDKFLACKHYYRISEKILYIFSFLGGALGAISAMIVFRHKTLKFRFYFINIICLVLWVLVLF